MLPDDDEFGRSSYNKSVTYKSIAPNLFKGGMLKDGFASSEYESSGVLSVSLNVTELAERLATKERKDESSFLSAVQDAP